MVKQLSIVMAYYNRRKLLFNTLKTIEKSLHKDKVEIIIVDDASVQEHQIDDFLNIFDLDINLIKIKKEEKNWINPCIPFNIGFKNVNTDIVILQNPECIHFGDIIEYTLNNIKENTYLNYACYSLDSNLTNKIDVNGSIGKVLTPLVNRSVVADGTTGWYNHSKYRPHKLHFCSAMMTKDLNELGGFDEAYKNGIGYDDNDFLLKIERKGMKIEIIDRPFVIHQYHGLTNYSNTALVERNCRLYKSKL